MEESNNLIQHEHSNLQHAKGSTARGQLRRRRRRQRRRGHKKGRTMEGIRLRSDSDGSTKNAFYQGTIVSDYHHGNVTENDLQSSNSNQSEVLQNGYPRRKIKVKNEYSRGIPPPSRRSSRNSSLESIDDPYRLISPENSNSNTEDDDPILNFSPDSNDHKLMAGQRDWTHQRDSLRYSTLSFPSVASQRKSLVGTSLLNDDGSRDSTGEPFAELNIESPLFGISKSDDEDDLGGLHIGNKAGRRRSSLFSVNSGVYFRHPAPSGPMSQGTVSGGIMNSGYKSESKLTDRISDNYSTQQASNTQYSQSYGSINVSPRQKAHSTNPAPPTIDEDEEGSEDSKEYNTFCDRITKNVDISGWLSKDVVYDDEGVPYFESSTNWSVAGIIRWLFYNPFYPEFTSLQQFCWAVVLGVFMGIFTAGWKLLIDACVEFTWRTIPEKLLEWGFFTDLDGAFPLYHYMWITPGVLSGILAYVVNSLPTPIPTQDDWIHTLHSNGIQDSRTFIPTFIVSTIGMTSGLSLGPELPLILTAGMIGSCLGRICRQSLLQARVMNLTAAAAAIGGMFGFPLAGGIFVMELPHRMGLQYFEALSPATIASIVAVLINRIVTNNDVTGMFQYPFLNESLPSYIFKDAIIYGLFGGALGIFYTFSVKKVKKYVYHIRDGCSSPSTTTSTNHTEHPGESTPIISPFYLSEKKPSKADKNKACPSSARLIPHKPTRAALTSATAGIIVGTIGMFLPHVMFWGEAQLQTMIDKRTTPLPIFGQGDEPTAALVALGQCMVNQSEGPGLSIGCSIAIVFAKIFVTGLSLSTGIVGGHFWAPLFVGATASQFFVELVTILSNWLGTPTSLTQYPCVALLCIMGATHVVTCKFIHTLYLYFLRK
jgi:H+/Cl- antiporter ClcA